MHIWLITIGEPLPIDKGNPRLHRTGTLADFLVQKGHDVLWWTSTFDHLHKFPRFSKDTEITLRDNYRLRLMHARSYRKNISLSRIWNHYTIARRFKRLAESEPPPDVILCSLPTLDFSVAATKYGEDKKIPVVLDVRDMWPDIFLRVVPRWSSGLARAMLWPMFRMARVACSRAFAICGHAPAFVEWGLRYGGRERTEYDRDFPFGYVQRRPDQADMQKAAEFWKSHGVIERAEAPIICFFGTIGHQFDLETVIEAARAIRKRREVQFVICGNGDRLDEYRATSQDCPNVVFPGWVNIPEIQMLMRMARLALAPYRDTPDFEASISNKAIEYLSGGLPILSSLKRGILNDLLVHSDCGMSYHGKSEALEEIVCNLCASPARLEELSQHASALFEARFTASKVYGEMVEHLERIASAGSATGTSETGTQPSKHNRQQQLGGDHP